MPYSGGAQGPSPSATRLAIMSYHSSLVFSRNRPTMSIVMLSQPTPPVSLFEARQLFIRFSQMTWSSCPVATPRRTNSVTDCEDTQSQIPKPTARLSPRQPFRFHPGRARPTYRRKRQQGIHRRRKSRAQPRRDMP